MILNPIKKNVKDSSVEELTEKEFFIWFLTMRNLKVKNLTPKEIEILAAYTVGEELTSSNDKKYLKKIEEKGYNLKIQKINAENITLETKIKIVNE